MPRPIEAIVHRDALAANLEVAREAAAGARVWAVVKADAYGHGIVNAFPALQRADGFALLDIGEAELLRDLGWRGPILLLEGCFDARDLETCSRLHLWHVVHDTQQIDRLAALKTDRPQRVFLKMNSGMNRLGFAPERYRAAWLRLDALDQVESIVHMTHLANADAGDAAAVEPALAAFEAATHDLPGERSICNSAATLRFGARLAAGGTAWVRPGIVLYGSSPDAPLHSAGDWKLAPAMTLRTRLIAVQELAIGASIGYGSSFIADRPMRIGVAACGYADGYPRLAPGGNERGTPVLVAGVRTRTVGRVSMDMITVDLGAVPTAAIGSEVVLWGRAGDGTVLSIDDVALAAGTVGYELMCARAPRVPVSTA
ncbi:MAG TPA: alanine racemase [Caldimonas sp.]|jgi:alanine racemase|nr:alanine racemase [Caldimonas sp.]HEV7578080.1 alanine racemase [Caldimonas sp.]